MDRRAFSSFSATVTSIPVVAVESAQMKRRMNGRANKSHVNYARIHEADLRRRKRRRKCGEILRNSTAAVTTTDWEISLSLGALREKQSRTNERQKKEKKRIMRIM